MFLYVSYSSRCSYLFTYLILHGVLARVCKLQKFPRGNMLCAYISKECVIKGQVEISKFKADWMVFKAITSLVC